MGTTGFLNGSTLNFFLLIGLGMRDLAGPDFRTEVVIDPGEAEDVFHKDDCPFCKGVVHIFWVAGYVQRFNLIFDDPFYDLFYLTIIVVSKYVL